jgi:hypothetical protein
VNGYDQAYLQDLATCRFIAQKVAVLIAGPCGTGKSHIAQALGHCAVRAGYDVLFTTQSKLLGNLHAARATGNFQRRCQTMVRTALLVIDDFGLKPLRAPHDEDFHDLVAERYERAATIVTSKQAFHSFIQQGLAKQRISLGACLYGVHKIFRRNHHIASYRFRYAYAAFTFTVFPIRASMLTSLSMVNLSILPRIRSLILGW